VQPWYERKYQNKGLSKDIDDTMTFQGSCWFANREYFMNMLVFWMTEKKTYGTFAGDKRR